MCHNLLAFMFRDSDHRLAACDTTNDKRNLVGKLLAQKLCHAQAGTVVDALELDFIHQGFDDVESPAALASRNVLIFTSRAFLTILHVNA
jgi:hypothetical protein